MKSLIIRTPESVGNSDDFKKVGFTNIAYTANIAAIDPAKPPVLRFRFTAGRTVKVEISGATIYKANNATGVVDFATPYSESVTFTDAGGITAAFAFVPTKSKGFIRITNTGDTLVNLQSPATANDAIKFNFEPSEFKNVNKFLSLDFGLPTGYVFNRVKFIGDINGLSTSEVLDRIEFPSSNLVESNFRNAIWDKKLPNTLTRIALSNTGIKADIDLSILPSSLLYIDFRNNVGIGFYGDASYILRAKDYIFFTNNFTHEKITGSLQSLSTSIKRIDINLPNIGAGYTSRTYTNAIEAVYITAPKVPATDFDLLLSDLANSPAVTGTLIRVSSRTSASDASVSALVAKGCTVVIA